MMDRSFNVISSTRSFLYCTVLVRNAKPDTGKIKWTQENNSRGSLNKILSFLSQMMVYSNS